MNLQRQIVRRRLKRRGPVPFAIAVVTACMVVLIGLISGHEPFTILIRAGVSAGLLGCLVSFGLSVIDIANS